MPAIKNTIEQMQDIAKHRGGKCLSDYYEYNYVPLRWECSKGHQWNAVPYSVKRGTWCPICAPKRQPKFSIVDVRKLAVARGGRCVSSEYHKTTDSLLWECAKGHQWEAAFCDVKRRTWCPVCHNLSKMLDLSYAKEIAEENLGKCLSSEYKGAKEKLFWECERGHRWYATFSNVKDNGS